MNEQLRKWKMLGLDQRIQLTLEALSCVQDPKSVQCRRLSEQYLRLIRQRNELLTPEETHQIERERGIV